MPKHEARPTPPTPDNCFEQYVLDVWKALSRGQQTKAKSTARESFYGLVSTWCAQDPKQRITVRMLVYIETEYVHQRQF
jgi:hypothetical protein